MFNKTKGVSIFKNNRIKYLPFVLSLLLIVVVYAQGGVDEVIKKMFISDKQSNQALEILDLRKKGNERFGKYDRQEKIIMGELPSNQKRIKLDAVKDIAANNHQFEDVVAQMNLIQGAPDFVGGSGVTFREYWLDDTGLEKIIVIDEQKDIYYSKMIDDTTVEKTEKLF